MTSNGLVRKAVLDLDNMNQNNQSQAAVNQTLAATNPPPQVIQPLPEVSLSQYHATTLEWIMVRTATAQDLRKAVSDLEKFTGETGELNIFLKGGDRLMGRIEAKMSEDLLDSENAKALKAAVVCRVKRKMAEHLVPLNNLLKKGWKMIVTPMMEDNIRRCMERLQQEPVLAFPDFNQQFTITTDASQTRSTFRKPSTHWFSQEFTVNINIGAAVPETIPHTSAKVTTTTTTSTAEVTTTTTTSTAEVTTTTTTSTAEVTTPENTLDTSENPSTVPSIFPSSTNESPTPTTTLKCCQNGSHTPTQKLKCCQNGTQTPTPKLKCCQNGTQTPTPKLKCCPNQSQTATQTLKCCHNESQTPKPTLKCCHNESQTPTPTLKCCQNESQTGTQTIKSCHSEQNTKCFRRPTSKPCCVTKNIQTSSEPNSVTKNENILKFQPTAHSCHKNKSVKPNCIGKGFNQVQTIENDSNGITITKPNTKVIPTQIYPTKITPKIRLENPHKVFNNLSTQSKNKHNAVYKYPTKRHSIKGYEELQYISDLNKRLDARIAHVDGRASHPDRRETQQSQKLHQSILSLSEDLYPTPASPLIRDGIKPLKASNHMTRKKDQLNKGKILFNTYSKGMQNFLGRNYFEDENFEFTINMSNIEPIPATFYLTSTTTKTEADDYEKRLYNLERQDKYNLTNNTADKPFNKLFTNESHELLYLRNSNNTLSARIAHV
ncbi:mucin-3B-like [Halyomorpha halys]|uniref:mucin-3B-like n=1 Tax=Halyomorpha halys TaxID=286706 RepID=UPI0034D26BA0